MAKVTIKSLQAQLAEVTATSEARSKMIHDTRQAKLAADEREKEAREQFADLKKRLHNSEMENARLTGYVARVREDDTVREELIPTGDPEGGQRLVPKRKPEYLGNREYEGGMSGLTGACEDYGRRRERPKHWVEY